MSKHGDFTPHLCSSAFNNREDYSRLVRGNGNRDFPLVKLSSPSPPARSAKDAASKHSRAQDGWQAAVVGVGIGRRGGAPGREVCMSV